MSAEWHLFKNVQPQKTGYIWITLGPTQVRLAHWSMERMREYSNDLYPGITWCQPWVGDGQPSHWCEADIPSAPPDARMISNYEFFGDELV